MAKWARGTAVLVAGLLVGGEIQQRYVPALDRFFDPWFSQFEAFATVGVPLWLAVLGIWLGWELGKRRAKGQLSGKSLLRLARKWLHRILQEDLPAPGGVGSPGGQVALGGFTSGSEHVAPPPLHSQSRPEAQGLGVVEHDPQAQPDQHHGQVRDRGQAGQEVDQVVSGLDRKQQDLVHGGSGSMELDEHEFQTLRIIARAGTSASFSKVFEGLYRSFPAAASNAPNLDLLLWSLADKGLIDGHMVRKNRILRCGASRAGLAYLKSRGEI